MTRSKLKNLTSRTTLKSWTIFGTLYLRKNPFPLHYEESQSLSGLWGQVIMAFNIAKCKLQFTTFTLTERQIDFWLRKPTESGNESWAFLPALSSLSFVLYSFTFFWYQKKLVFLTLATNLCCCHRSRRLHRQGCHCNRYLKKTHSVSSRVILISQITWFRYISFSQDEKCRPLSDVSDRYFCVTSSSPSSTSGN